ncbi:hypothetical protein L1887_62386 [Cichorium endivia]|nr:hypothetical protein L1887_62386 [Cichorium endivia]
MGGCMGTNSSQPSPDGPGVDARIVDLARAPRVIAARLGRCNWKNERRRVTFDLGFPALASTLERDSNPQLKRSFVKGWGRTRLVPSGESQLPLPHSSARGVCEEEKTINPGQECGRAALRADERGNAVGSKCAFRLGFASHRAASRSGIGGGRTSHVRIAVVTMGGRSSAVGNGRTRARRPPGMQENAGLKFQRAGARSGVAWREARGKRRNGWAASQTETCMRFFALPAFYFTRRPSSAPASFLSLTAFASRWTSADRQDCKM